MRIRHKIAVVGLGSPEGPAFIEMQADLDNRDRSRNEAVRTAVERGFPVEDARRFPTVLVDPEEASALASEGISPRFTTMQIVRDCGIAEGTTAILANDGMTSPIIVVIDARWHDRNQTPSGGIACRIDGKMDAVLTRDGGGDLILTIPLLVGEPKRLVRSHLIDGIVLNEALRQTRGLGNDITKWRAALPHVTRQMTAAVIESAANFASACLAGPGGIVETRISRSGTARTTVLRDDGEIFEGPAFRFDGARIAEADSRSDEPALLAVTP